MSMSRAPVKRGRKMKKSSIYKYYCPWHICTQLFKAVMHSIMNVLFIV
jgi:hypothetical protein